MTQDRDPSEHPAPNGPRGPPIVWIDARTPAPETTTGIVTAALENGFSHIVVAAEERDRLLGLGRFAPLVVTSDGGPGALIVGGDGPVGRWITLRGKGDEAEASSLAGTIEAVVVEATDWRIIPLENLIADFQPTRSRLLAHVRTAEEAEVMLATLEVGTDGVVLATDDPQEVIDLATRLADRATETLALEEAEILSITDAGTGDRVCIDSCSLLAPGEGMLVGGTGQGFLLVHSESLAAEYVNARPFRVNAGAVSAYVLATGGRTHYLSEVQAGMPVLAVDHRGRTRAVTVGRSKVESRPLLLVRVRAAADPAAEAHLVVQNAETIRFVTPGGGALSVVDARPGDRVLLHRVEGARHFGRQIRERILER